MDDLKPLRDLLCGGLVAGLGAWVWSYAGGFPALPEGYPGPSLFPRVIAAGLMLSGLALIVDGFVPLNPFRRAIRTPLPPAGGLARLALIGALVALSPLVQDRLGFVPVVGVLILAVGRMLGVRFRVAVPTALLGALLVYWLFSGLLGVPL